MVCSAGAQVAGKILKSVLAKHGFSAVVRTTLGDRTRTMFFGFEGVIHRSRLLGYSGRRRWSCLGIRTGNSLRCFLV
jgi:hypothetical protein